MIGGPVKLQVMSENNKKQRESVALSNEVIKKLEAESHKNNLSKSEITEFALRKLFNLSTGSSKNMLTEIYIIATNI